VPLHFRLGGRIRAIADCALGPRIPQPREPAQLSHDWCGGRHSPRPRGGPCRTRVAGDAVPRIRRAVPLTLGVANYFCRRTFLWSCGRRSRGAGRLGPGVPAVTGEPIIRVNGLTYAFPGGQTALKDVCFTVAAEEPVGIMGRNGAGKTTLFLCLAGVLRARRDVISLAGIDPADPAQRSKLPAKVGVVFQNSDDQLFNATVFDDVAFGPLNLGLAPEDVR